MSVRIVYCTACGYERHAVRLAAEIKKARGIDVELVKGSGGVFDVFKDAERVFSKHEEHRFPEASEILAEL
jgi:selenoprotein W-related protein